MPGFDSNATAAGNPTYTLRLYDGNTLLATGSTSWNLQVSLGDAGAPEPAAGGLAALGMLALGLWRRARRGRSERGRALS